MPESKSLRWIDGAKAIPENMDAVLSVMSLLLIDDDEPLIELLRVWLGNRTIQVARTIAEAAAQIAEHAPKHIILDLKLPDSMPAQTIARIKALKNSAQDAVVIVITGYPCHQAEAIAAGADRFIPKGGDARVFAQQLEDAIDDDGKKESTSQG
jgi:two-component system, response regulator RegA